jgi:uncharacterized protein (DUF2249 family)
MQNPEWFNEKNIVSVFDARPIISGGGHPMMEVFDEANKLNTGEILDLITPFVPAPLIDKLHNMGFETFAKESEGNIFHTYISK